MVGIKGDGKSMVHGCLGVGEVLWLKEFWSEIYEGDGPRGVSVLVDRSVASLGILEVEGYRAKVLEVQRMGCHKFSSRVDIYKSGVWGLFKVYESMGELINSNAA